jgi:hypothetical protein
MDTNPRAADISCKAVSTLRTGLGYFDINFDLFAF